MSTEIESAVSERTLTLTEADEDGDVLVTIQGYGDQSKIYATRANFLTAVATECHVRIVEKSTVLTDEECGVFVGAHEKIVPADAVVVLREEMPEVEVTSDGKPWAAGRTALDAEHARGAARAYLALAAWHAAHPPVDDEQVDRIATVLADDQTLCSLNVRARALYLAGVRFVAQP